MMSRLYGEVKKNGISNTYYKVKEKQAKNLALKDYDRERPRSFLLRRSRNRRRNAIL